MRCWPHSGFSVDNSVYVPPHDTAGLERLAQYILRCPFSLARVVRLTDDGSVIYRAERDHCRRFPGAASGGSSGRTATELPGFQRARLPGGSHAAHSRKRRAPGALLRLVLTPAARHPGQEPQSGRARIGNRSHRPFGAQSLQVGSPWPTRRIRFHLGDADQARVRSGSAGVSVLSWTDEDHQLHRAPPGGRDRACSPACWRHRRRFDARNCTKAFT